MTTFTYIKRNHRGYYVELPEPIDEEYWEGLIGTTYDDFIANKWVLLSKKLVQFHNLYPNASIKEVLDTQLTPVPPRTLGDAKNEKIEEIEAYDNSDSVNSFTITMDGDSIDAWITPDKRADYALSIESAKKLQMAEVTPVFNGVPVTLSIETAEMALAQIQIYANRCFNVTETHKAEVNALESIEDVDAYDVSLGYPEKLTFNL